MDNAIQGKFNFWYTIWYGNKKTIYHQQKLLSPHSIPKQNVTFDLAYNSIMMFDNEVNNIFHSEKFSRDTCVQLHLLALTETLVVRLITSGVEVSVN